MSEDDLVAPSEATVEVVTEPTEQTNVPAPETAEAEASEQTETQKRRERRKLEQQRILEDKTAAEQKLADTQARLARVQASAAGHVEPKEADYADIGAYWAAMGAFNYARQVAQSAVAEVSAEAEQAKQASDGMRAAHMQARQAELAEERQDALKRYPDYDAALAVAMDPRVVSGPLSELVLMADQPADLAYHLGKNPDVARQLSNMPPQAAAYALGKIAAGLTVPQLKMTSNAPAPINPVRPSGTASKDIASMSGAEYIAARANGWHP